MDDQQTPVDPLVGGVRSVMETEGNSPSDDELLHQAFHEDGFVSLPGFLRPNEVEMVRKQTHRFIAETVPTLPPAVVYCEEKGNLSTLKQVQQLFQFDRFFAAMMFGSRFEKLARVLLGEPAVGRNMQYFNKPPGSNDATPPHQDGAFFFLQSGSALTMWLALEDVEEEQGCVRYIHGSHKLGLRPHVNSGVLGFSQRIEDFGTQHDQENEVPCPADAGQLIVHHDRMIHYAHRNTTLDRGREALGFIYYGESAKDDAKAYQEYQAELAARLAGEGRV